MESVERLDKGRDKGEGQTATIQLDIQNTETEKLNLKSPKIDSTGKLPTQFSSSSSLPNRVYQTPNSQNDLVKLDFINISYEVNTKVGKKKILNQISGFVDPGEILYIMGPSGGGKTSLLDFLCNRTKKSPEGSIFINEKSWTVFEFKKIARYCLQNPLLYEILTVKETLEYAASFFTKNIDERKERASRVIELLGLEGQRDTRIGGVFFRGISGGQKQRVSVGEQLVANPKILFLDEPTSGLDSAASFQLMQSLQFITKKTKICTILSIHQPSQRVFELSDRLMLLAGGKNFGGKTAYFGKTSEVKEHFKSIGVVNKTNCSISEWCLDLVNGDFGDQQTIQNIIEKFKESQAQKILNERHDRILKKLNQNAIEDYKFQGNYLKQSWLKDTIILTKRGYKNQLKNPIVLFIRIFVNCVMALVLGTVWLGVGEKPKQGEVNDLQGVLYFTSSFFSLMTIALCPTNIEDKLIMIKEKSNGCYKLMSFSIANLITSLPVTLVISVLCSGIIFTLVQFENNNEQFIKFTLNLFFTLVCAESFMLLISQVCSHLLVCIIIIALLQGTQMILQGFFIKKSSIPVGWIWLYYFNYNTYSFKNFMLFSFENLTINKDTQSVPPVLQDYSGYNILQNLDMQDSSFIDNLLYLTGFIFLYRVFAVAYSYFTHTGKK